MCPERTLRLLARPARFELPTSAFGGKRLILLIDSIAGSISFKASLSHLWPLLSNAGGATWRSMRCTCAAPADLSCEDEIPQNRLFLTDVARPRYHLFRGLGVAQHERRAASS